MYKQLTSEQRSQIFALLQKKVSKKEIAKIIGVHPSTITREIRRNSQKGGNYLWNKAHEKAMARRKRTVHNAALDPILVWRIEELIKTQQWSPRQISGYLKKEGISVSHQTIYNLIHRDTSGELARHTRHKMKYKKRTPYRCGPIKNRVSIHQRSPEANGKRFGDFEMDLIVDSKHHAILTLVERSTNMLFMARLPHGKKAKYVAQTVRRILLPYRKHLLTITTDNGPEFAYHQQITKDLCVPVYFADPYSSWQKGAIENTNKLIRQYIPKDADFNDYTDKRIMAIQKKLNQRPRQKLGFSTPKVEFYKRIT